MPPTGSPMVVSQEKKLSYSSIIFEVSEFATGQSLAPAAEFSGAIVKNTFT
jgi:hypothetical protein